MSKYFYQMIKLTKELLKLTTIKHKVNHI